MECDRSGHQERTATVYTSFHYRQNKVIVRFTFRVVLCLFKEIVLLAGQDVDLTKNTKFSWIDVHCDLRNLH